MLPAIVKVSLNFLSQMNGFQFSKLSFSILMFILCLASVSFVLNFAISGMTVSLNVLSLSLNVLALSLNVLTQYLWVRPALINFYEICPSWYSALSSIILMLRLHLLCLLMFATLRLSSTLNWNWKPSFSCLPMILVSCFPDFSCTFSVQLVNFVKRELSNYNTIVTFLIVSWEVLEGLALYKCCVTLHTLYLFVSLNVFLYFWVCFYVGVGLWSQWFLTSAIVIFYFKRNGGASW